ncbi:MAG: response regulator [Gammaproteobacteria bacterium]
MRVLLIEDQPADAELTLRNLQSNGIDCGVERVDTEVALRRALLNAPALIISDAQLPGFDAESALAIARELAPRIPFIVFSGAPWDHRAQALLAAGATDYVCKADPRALAPAVRRALALLSDR